MSTVPSDGAASLADLEMKGERPRESPPRARREDQVHSSEDVELSTMNAIHVDEPSVDVPTPADPGGRAQQLTELISFCAILWVFFLEGWNDGTSGPMLPRMQKHYGVRVKRGRRTTY